MNLPKKGFEVPLANWFRKDLRSMVEHVSMKKNLDKIGIENHALINSWKDDLFFNNPDLYKINWFRNSQWKELQNDKIKKY